MKADPEALTFSFEGDIWRWQGGAPAAWHFITLPDGIAAEIKFFSGKRKGFGMVRVTAVIGATRWKSSLFPDKTSGSYLLPVKADVRKAESLQTGQRVSVRLSLDL